MAFKETHVSGSSTGPDGPQAPTAGRPWLITGVVLIAAFMELLDVTILNVAIPSIRTSLKASYGELQWMVAGYQLTFAVGLMTGGRLGDIYGRRKTFVIGVAAFVVASVFCGTAADPAMLVTGRVIQGLASAIMLPQVLSTIHVTFPAEKRQAAFAVFGSVVGMAALVGPLVGGVVINANVFSLDWRPIFFINVPLGLIAIVGALVFIGESKSPDRPRLDPLGVVLASAGAFLVVFPLIQGRDSNWAPWTWVCLAASVPVFAVFVLTQRRKIRKDGSSLLDLNLFRHRGFVVGLLVTLVFFCGVTSFSLIFMISLQVGHGYSALRAGLAVLPLALGAGVGSGMSAALVKALGRTVLQLGAILGVIGMAWLSIEVAGHSDHLTVWAMLAPLAVAGLGLGIVLAPLSDIVLAGTRLTSTGSASGMLSTMIQLGGAVGVALIGTVFFGLIGSRASSVSADIRPAISHQLQVAGVPATAARQIEAGFATCFHDQATAKDSAVTPASCRQAAQTQSSGPVKAILTRAGTQAQHKDFSQSLARTLYYDVGIFALTFLLVFFMPKISKQDLERVAVADQ